MWRFSFVSLSLLVVVHSQHMIELFCPDGWIRGGMLCYKVFEEKKTWNEAEDFCRALKHTHCRMGSIQNSMVTDDLERHLSRNFPNIGNVWTGLRYSPNSGCWDWRGVYFVKYTSWAEGKPDNMDKRHYCGELVAKTGYKYWNNRTCDFRMPFICQCQSSPRR